MVINVAFALDECEQSVVPFFERLAHFFFSFVDKDAQLPENRIDLLIDLAFGSHKTNNLKLK